MKKSIQLILICLVLIIVYTVSPALADVTAYLETKNSGVNLPEFSAALIAIYEIVVRVIPTAKNWSIVHGIIRVFAVLSDLLNVKRV